MIKTYSEFLEEMVVKQMEQTEPPCCTYRKMVKWCQEHCGKTPTAECLKRYYFEKIVEPSIGDIIRETFERR